MAFDVKRNKQQLWRDMFFAHTGIISTETLPETLWVKKIIGAITGTNIDGRALTYLQALRKLVVAVGGTAGTNDNERECFIKIAERVSGQQSSDTYHGLKESMYAACWSPKRLFSAGDNGGWWPIYPGVNLYQDEGKTTFASVATDPVHVIADLSGLGNDFVAGSAGARPLLQTDGKWYLEFDGVDDFLQAGTGIDLQANKMLLGANVSFLTGTAYDAIIVGKVKNVSTWEDNYGVYCTDPGALENIGFVVGDYLANNAGFSAVGAVKYTTLGYCDGSLMRSRRDGTQIASISSGESTTSLDQTYMARGNGSANVLFTNMKMYECFLLNNYREFSAAESWLILRT